MAHKARRLPGVKVATGTVVAGRIVVEGPALPEGSRMTVVVAEDTETFELSPDDETVLLEAIREADDGALVSGDDLLASLRRPA
jgi:hypothetical protein